MCGSSRMYCREMCVVPKRLNCMSEQTTKTRWWRKISSIRRIENLHQPHLLCGNIWCSMPLSWSTSWQRVSDRFPLVLFNKFYDRPAKRLETRGSVSELDYLGIELSPRIVAGKALVGSTLWWKFEDTVYKLLRGSRKARQTNQQFFKPSIPDRMRWINSRSAMEIASYFANITRELYPQIELVALFGAAVIVLQENKTKATDISQLNDGSDVIQEETFWPKMSVAWAFSFNQELHILLTRTRPFSRLAIPALQTMHHNEVGIISCHSPTSNADDYESEAFYFQPKETTKKIGTSAFAVGDSNTRTRKINEGN